MATYTKINTLRAHKEAWQESTESGESKSTFSSTAAAFKCIIHFALLLGRRFESHFK
jgi:hypothetical protein